MPWIRRVFSEARILPHVVETDDAFAAKGRTEHGGGAGHGKFLEGRARHAGERVEHVGAAFFVEHVVKKGAELRPGHAGAGVGDGLHHFVEVELGRDRGRDLVEALGDGVFLLQRLLFLPALGHVVENHDRADDLAGRISDRGGAVLDRNLAAVSPNENGVIGQAPGSLPPRARRRSGCSPVGASFPRSGAGLR